MQTSGLKKIGIIADSHGKPDTISKAVTHLKNNRCDKIIHLGDICDTLFPETCNVCIQILEDNDVVAVKGNNDHMLQINQIGNLESPISHQSLSYLKNLSPVIQCDNVYFAHSLPYYDEMGISCITRGLGKQDIKKFFSVPGEKILFRGHGHTPEIIWEKEGLYYREVFSTNKTVDLKPFLPCIITCGALTRGLCMIWDIDTQMLTSLSIKAES